MDWKKNHLYLYTFCRYFMATIIISYAFAKILGTQFVTQPSVYDKPIGSLTGFQLTWYYFGYSYWYGLVIAITQIASSLLLFFRRTTRIGVILFLTFMINILMMDFAYDIVGAKAMACLLTIMALFVLFSDYKALLKYFVQEPPLFQDDNRPAWMKKIGKIKYIYIPLVFIVFFVLITTLKGKYMGQNAFYGTWENVQTKERMYFEAANTFQVYRRNELKNFANGTYTFTKDSLMLDYPETKSVKGANYLSGAYQLTENDLTILTEKGSIRYKRIR